MTKTISRRSARPAAIPALLPPAGTVVRFTVAIPAELNRELEAWGDVVRRNKNNAVTVLLELALCAQAQARQALNG